LCPDILKISDEQLSMNASLIVVAKKPQRGSTKTRQRPPTPMHFYGRSVSFQKK
jgi:hypothetical protein